MTNTFYQELKSAITECEAHPYKSTFLDDSTGWRIYKNPLGQWSESDYDILLNHQDATVNNLCDNSTLQCFVYCDKGGFIYLAFK